MSRRIGHALCAAVLLACGTAAAAGFWESLDRAIRLQLEENFEDAIAAYQQAQIERPEAGIVHYGLGSTYYQQGAALETADADAAMAAFQQAAAAFDKLENATDPDLRREAAYGAASARARAARLAAGLPGTEGNPVRDLRDVIENLEGFLEQYPEHDAARHTLDATRYSLKTLLQEPPPPPQPEQQPGDNSEDEGEEEEQEQAASQGQQGEEQESQDGEAPEDGSQPEASPDEPQEDQEPEGEQPPPPQPEDEQGEEQQEEDASASEGQPEEQQEEQELAAADQDERKDMPNIEAILQSLEDMDRREQRDMRTGAGGPEVRGAWW
jgi:hypothetical protein